MTTYREAHREEKRRAARERYYQLHPVRPSPVCCQCGASIPFTGKGRPRTTCDSRGRCSNVQKVAA